MELCFYFALAYALLIMDDVIADERHLFPSFSKLMFQEDISKVESKVSSKINDGIDEIWNLMFRLCEGQAEEDIAEYIESAMKKVKVKHDGNLAPPIVLILSRDGLFNISKTSFHPMCLLVLWLVDEKYSFIV
jgi:hypothetical protein